MAEPRTVRENANSLTSEEIAAILPHRYPFALVDRILDYEPGQWAIGRKCVTRNEEFFNGHYSIISRPAYLYDTRPPFNTENSTSKCAPRIPILCVLRMISISSVHTTGSFST